MQSIITGVIAVVLLAEALFLIYLGVERRTARAWVGAILSAAAFILILMPDSTFFNLTAGTFGKSAAYVDAILYIGSTVGQVTYVVFIVLFGLLGGIYRLLPRWAATGETERQDASLRRHRKGRKSGH